MGGENDICTTIAGFGIVGIDGIVVGDCDCDDSIGSDSAALITAPLLGQVGDTPGMAGVASSMVTAPEVGE